MTFDYLGESALDYDPCHYGSSKLIFRGPQRSLKGGYCAVIGGTETFGRFVEEPFPALLEAISGRKIVNLGCMHAGPDVFANDPSVMDICVQADVTIVQLMGAQNMSNRFYSVHPRRNDRFLKATKLLRSIYKEVDFTEIHFTGHLLSTLEKASADRFKMVREELQKQWVSEMKALLDKISGKVVLLWLSDRAPDAAKSEISPFQDPVFLNRQTIDKLTTCANGLVEVVVSPQEISAGHERMIFTQLEEAAARQMLGPIAHQEAARQLRPLLDIL